MVLQQDVHGELLLQNRRGVLLLLWYYAVFHASFNHCFMIFINH